MITDRYFVTGGTVTGINHRVKGRNNQDGLAIAKDEKHIVAVVADGCSSSISSEVGARLIAKFVAEETLRLARDKNGHYVPDILPLLEESLIGFLKDISNKFIDPLEIVDEMLLATVVGTVVNSYMATVFSIGDGVISVNSEVTIIDEDNTPTYPAYKIFPGSYCFDESKIHFAIRKEIGLDDLQSIVIATDGAAELQAKADEFISILGKKEKIGGVEQFEKEEKYLKNPSLLQKRLFQLNAEKTAIDWEKKEIKKFNGILNDDTTVIIVRRR
jgi:hypothetical protein